MCHDDELNKSLTNEELYRMKYNQLSVCLQKLCDHLLGENWYIAAPVDETTACEIITDEICKRYKNVNNTLGKKFNEYMKKHINEIIHEN